MLLLNDLELLRYDLLKSLLLRFRPKRDSAHFIHNIPCLKGFIISQILSTNIYNSPILEVSLLQSKQMNFFLLFLTVVDLIRLI